MACGATSQYHSHMVEIVAVSSAAEMDAVRVLFDEYKKAVGVDLWFGAAFQKELDELPSPYLAPAGRLVVARDGVEVAGCGGLRPHQPVPRLQAPRVEALLAASSGSSGRPEVASGIPDTALAKPLEFLAWAAGKAGAFSRLGCR
jgi:hypothetical protein